MELPVTFILDKNPKHAAYYLDLSFALDAYNILHQLFGIVYKVGAVPEDKLLDLYANIKSNSSVFSWYVKFYKCLYKCLQTSGDYPDLVDPLQDLKPPFYLFEGEYIWSGVGCVHHLATTGTVIETHRKIYGELYKLGKLSKFVGLTPYFLLSGGTYEYEDIKDLVDCRIEVGLGGNYKFFIRYDTAYYEVKFPKEIVNFIEPLLIKNKF